MLPLRHKKSGSYQWVYPQKQASKTFSITRIKPQRQQSEIKQHLKTYNYTNSRSYLIESAKKALKPTNSESLDTDSKLRTVGNLWSSLIKNKRILPNNKIDTIGQSCRTVSGNFRRRIWKSNDMTPSLKFHHHKITLSNCKLLHGQQGILGQKDPIPIRIQNFSLGRQKKKNQFRQKSLRESRYSRKEISHTNPQIKIIDKTLQTQKIVKTESKVQVNANTLLNHSYNSLIQEENSLIPAGSFKRNKLSDSKALLEPW